MGNHYIDLTYYVIIVYTDEEYASLRPGTRLLLTGGSGIGFGLARGVEGDFWIGALEHAQWHGPNYDIFWDCRGDENKGRRSGQASYHVRLASFLCMGFGSDVGFGSGVGFSSLRLPLVVGFGYPGGFIKFP